jgi:hypothetical protein
MRATAFENTLKAIVENYDNKGQSEEKYLASNKVLMAKARILLSRENDSAVIREMVNQ